MAEPPAGRRARGSYAPLICLNCRARKIKCVLSDTAHIEPSDQPQPENHACQRCLHLGVDCIMQRTILGRPAAKRKRVADLPNNEVATHTSKESGASTAPNVVAEYMLDSLEITNFLLNGAATVESPATSHSVRRKINDREMFEALMSSSRLMSALLVHDRHFGSRTVAFVAQRPAPLVELVSQGMAALFDESLVWHRFYFPETPLLADLREELVALSESFSTVATHLLFALLCVIAMETPYCRLRQDLQLKLDLKAAVLHYGYQANYVIPAHRHFLTASTLMFHYKPTILANSPAVAATAVRADLYLALAKRVAKKLGLDGKIRVLQGYLRNPSGHDHLDLEELIYDALRWCNLVFEEALLDGYVVMSTTAMEQLIVWLGPSINTIRAVLKLHVVTTRMTYHYHVLEAWYMLLKGVLEAKRSWRDLDKLALVVEAHEQAIEEELQAAYTALRHAVPDEETGADADVVRRVLEMDVISIRSPLATVAMFYGVMARLKGANASSDEDIQPHEAVQIGDQVIEALKELRIGPAADFYAFLHRLGESRDTMLQQSLSRFITAADKWTLRGVPFIPPPRLSGLGLLMQCRHIVENHAARLKGWNGLHPNAELHLALFAGCADKLEGMCVGPGETIDDAFADGCLYAAGAKLLRCLHSIVRGWQETYHREGEKEAAAHVEPPSSSWAFDSMQPTLDDAEFDDLMTQWGQWPQSNTLDFSQFLPSEG